ncbi:MAG TPA: ABC transporter substrate-binding protein, partial [Gaiellaceae bacterium]|nr:ABC transporter substrate-binding protein [Gaiellaceae bacterium]
NLLGNTPCPTKWSQLKSAKYHNDVDLNGSPLSANAALSGVWAAAVNNGGSAKNIAPGVNFFKDLMSAGNFNSTDCNAAAVIATSCPITLNWDYLNTASAWGLPGATHWKVVDPKGIPFGGVYDQAVSKSAPHPAAARLWEEFLSSVKGQNIWLQGGARPVELGAMITAGTANKTALKALPKVSNLDKAVIPTTKQSVAASAYVTSNWP